MGALLVRPTVTGCAWLFTAVCAECVQKSGHSAVPAEWAGHSVNVLLRVYAKCIYGQDEAAKQRVQAALESAGSLGGDG